MGDNSFEAFLGVGKPFGVYPRSTAERLKKVKNRLKGLNEL